MKEQIDFEKLPPNWTVAQLGDHLERITNGLTATQEKDPPGIPVSRIETISDGTVNFEKVRYLRELDEEKKQNFLLKEGDLLFSHINSDLHLGKTAVYRSIKPLVHGMNLLLLRTRKESLDSYYLHYLLNYYRREGKFMEIAQHAVNQSSLNQKKIKGLRIPLAPVDQQKRIVAEIEKQFSRLDEAVANLKRVKANLKRYKAAVLKAAVEGKLTEEWRKAHPDVEPATELLKRVLAERRSKWDRKGKYKEPNTPDRTMLPSLPENWAWATLPQLGELNRGKSKHRPRDDPRLYGGNYPFIQTGDIRHATGVIKTYTQTYSEEGLKQSRLWPTGTLCITIAANIADTAILGFDACFPDSVVGFIPTSYDIDVRFSEYFLRTAKENIEQFAPATAQKNINLEILRDVAVPFPPQQEQGAIVAEVEQRLSLAENIEVAAEFNIARVDRLRQSVLTRAFSGQLPRCAEARVPSDTIAATSAPL